MGAAWHKKEPSKYSHFTYRGPRTIDGLLRYRKAQQPSKEQVQHLRAGIAEFRAMLEAVRR